MSYVDYGYEDFYGQSDSESKKKEIKAKVEQLKLVIKKFPLGYKMPTEAKQEHDLAVEELKKIQNSCIHSFTVHRLFRFDVQVCDICDFENKGFKPNG